MRNCVFLVAKSKFSAANLAFHHLLVSTKQLLLADTAFHVQIVCRLCRDIDILDGLRGLGGNSATRSLLLSLRQ